MALSLALFGSLLLAQGFPPLYNISPEQIESVEQVKDALHVYLDPPDFCDTMSCQFSLMVQTCTLIEMLDKRVDSRIPEGRSRGRNSLAIVPDDLQLMQLIYSQCQEVEGSEEEPPFFGGRYRVYQPSCSVNNQIRADLGLKQQNCY
ncbi:hypothetical protein IQ249_21990 [Lusitaniella coriacea LEGE 07157]|uniref:Uncharacterized protein n=1 Tax=Lusitaniella coriacea LEGE 07157 TaxID=945747 RepID=A0A8J7J6A3_9CYAN|nr:hypothetical protein [Lusitaniella coriacea]MBE9118564.1 hypothetical protein [Lusitaniella coriacea LEGE 07157]